ncbi:MAG: pilus assembly protein TadG-related protein [Acidimicrobiales bacterium]
MSALRWRGEDRGATLPFVALILPVLIVMTAFAVDLGRQRSDRRSAQAAADVVAIDMVRIIDDRSVADIYADPATQDSLTASAARNGFTNATLSPASGPRITAIEWGTISAVNNEFGALDPFDPGQQTIVPDAVRITAADVTDYLFQPGSGSVERTAVAQASDRKEAWFQVGSFLAGVNPASNTVIGTVLSQVVPGAELLSYNGLVGADLTLGQLEAGLEAVSPGAGLDTPISYRDLVLASATALQAEGGNTAAVDLLNGMAGTASTVEQITLGDLVSAQAAGGSPAASATYDVLGLLTGGAFLIDGDHAVSIPATNVNVVGVGDVDMSLQVIERPQIGGPNEGARASTGQFNLTLDTNLGVSTSQVTINLCTLGESGLGILGSIVGGLGSWLTCLLSGTINRAVTLDVQYDGDIDLRAAGADAVLQSIDCESTPPRITVAPEPIPLELLSDIVLTVRATVGGGAPFEIGRIELDAGAVTTGVAGPQTFLDPTEFGPPARRVGANPLGLAGLLNVTPGQIDLLQVPLSPLVSPLAVPLTNALNALLAEVDAQLLSTVANGLGLSLGGADLTALSMECELQRPRLVG